MLKKTAVFLIGAFIGGLIVFLIVRGNKTHDYFIESESKYSFDETVAQFEAIVNDAPGWSILKTYNLQESMKKHGYNVNSVKVFSICNPDYSSKILFSNTERIASSMMPCRISIYVKTNGKTYISRMNSADMAADMGGLINKVMSGASGDMEELIADLIKN